MLALVIVTLRLDANLLKHPLERAISAKTGRAFAIQGDLRLRLVPHLRLVMDGVRFANPAWAAEPEMLRIESADVSIALLPLLRGRVVLPAVTLAKPIVDLERNAQGANNWTLAKAQPQPGPPGEPPVIGLLTVDQGLLMFRDEAPRTALSLQLQTAVAADGSRGVRFNAYGQFRGQRLDAEGSGGPILSLADATLPYPLDGTFRVGATHGAVKGSITGLAAFAAADLELQLAGDTLSDLYPLVGLTLPPSPPYRVTGRLVRDAAAWHFRSFEGHVGDSDLSGDVDVAWRGRRLQLQARLTSQRVDLDDLGGFLGAQPQTGPGETSSARQKRQKAVEAARPNALPDMPIKLDRLRAMDADVQFAGESIRGRTPIDGLQTHLVLDDGVLTAKPLEFVIGGGNVVATLVLDGRGEHARVGSDVEFRRIDLRRIFPGNRVVARATGVLGGRAVLKGEGDSFAQVLGTADGNVGLAMSGGTVSNLALEAAGLDVAEALRLLFTGDKPVSLRCAVTDLGVKKGVMQSRATIIDTTDTDIKIDGTIDLAHEQLDLTLHPLPKDYSLVALRSPLHVRGTFKKPTVRPDKELAVRGGIAAILASVAAPAAALVALIETGPGDDVDCEHLIAGVERHVGEKVPEAGGSP